MKKLVNQKISEVVDQLNDYTAEWLLRDVCNTLHRQIQSSNRSIDTNRDQLADMHSRFTGQDWMDEKMQNKFEYIRNVESNLEVLEQLFDGFKHLYSEQSGSTFIPAQKYDAQAAAKKKQTATYAEVAEYLNK